MTIELHINGKPAKTWIVDYSFGPFPMSSEVIQGKETEMDRCLLECKIDADHIIYDNEYEMYATVQSSLRPWKINEIEYDQFLALVEYNKKRRAAGFKILRIMPEPKRKSKVI